MNSNTRISNLGTITILICIWVCPQEGEVPNINRAVVTKLYLGVDLEQLPRDRQAQGHNSNLLVKVTTIHTHLDPWLAMALVAVTVSVVTKPEVVVKSLVPLRARTG